MQYLYIIMKVVFLALLCLGTASASWAGGFLRSSSSAANQQVVPTRTASEPNRIQRLHKAFDITDPNEDIRTNILLNMEGI
jgi:hypothetical protein